MFSSAKWGICAYLKIAQYGEDAQEVYLVISKRKKHTALKSGHFTTCYTLVFDSLAAHWNPGNLLEYKEISCKFPYLFPLF